MDFLISSLKQMQIDSVEYPAVFLLLVIPVVYVLCSFIKPRSEMVRIRVPSIWYRNSSFERAKPGETQRPRIQWSWLNHSKRLWCKAICSFLAFVACLSLTIAIAHPYGGATNETRTEGIDIYFTLDMSASMKAYDYSLEEIQARYRLDLKTPNRFDMAKSTILHFIDSRSRRCHDNSDVIARCDRIGIVMFGENAFIDLPLTTDYNVLANHLKRRQIYDIEARQSAIGDGIMSAVASLRHSTAKSKNIILVSDGDLKGGRFSINQAIAAANQYDVHIYPIAIGAADSAVIAEPNPGRIMEFSVEDFPVNRAVLEKIATQTNGIAYNAANDDDFLNQLNDILDRLEPSISKEVRHGNQIDLSTYYILLGFVFLMLAHLVNMLFVHRYP